ncbi:S-layer homology domain-containing protein [Cohnella lupini]|uniref:S-layer family protein n=1 Tax=Cohnella lupini TaxID=1294267 RepID=A0A3D9HVM4_9BACL|nr:S-layer homology domain-containing protein [Cohnella lupini]RED52956.1 S-layer family protein [Cohnella lupini]
MNKTSILKKSIFTGLTFAMVLGGSAAAFANVNDKDKNKTENAASVRLLGSQEKAASASVKADESITRADMISLINRSFQLTEKAQITFSDLSNSDLAYDQIAIAVKAGYVKGYSDGTIRPNQNITHKDAIDMVANLVTLKLSSIKDKYLREAMIAGWSNKAIAGILDTEILDITIFWPKDKFTIKAAVTLIDKSLDFAKELGITIPKAPTGDTGTGTTPSTGGTGTGTTPPTGGTGTGTAPPTGGTVKTYDAAGVYGPATGKETIKGNVVVSAPSITLQNLVIEGDLWITAADTDGDAYFKNVTVKGVAHIQNGGVNNVHIEEGCDFASVKMY